MEGGRNKQKEVEGRYKWLEDERGGRKKKGGGLVNRREE